MFVACPMIRSVAWTLLPNTNFDRETFWNNDAPGAVTAALSVGVYVTTIPVFLSSTFRDFHGERDILVREIAPQLDDALREFGCRVEMIDLRWGVGSDVVDMDDAVKHARVLSVCFDEIERARPLFVGLVGHRYGWVPPMITASNVAGTRLAVDPAGMSATALEIEFGAFASSEQSMQALFFLRDINGEQPSGYTDDDLAAVHGMRDRIRLAALSNPRWSVNDYALDAEAGRIASFAPFADVAARVLTEAVVARVKSLPEQPTDPIAAAEQLFFESRVVVEGRGALIEQAVSLLLAGTSVCLLGESGMGKSAIWCQAIERVGKARRAIRAAIASSELLTSYSGIVGRLASQLDLAPSSSGDDRALLDWWRHELGNRDGLVVGIDGIDGLDQGGAREDLGCVLGMPATHFVTTTDHGHAKRLRANGFAIVEVGPLSAPASAAAAGALVDRLQRTLPQRAIELLADQPRSPLWLQLALGEITSLGEEVFAEIDPADPVRALGELIEWTIAQLPADLPNMIRRQTSRIGRRLGVNPTHAILSGLALSRSGLAPVDLTTSMGVTELDVAVVRRSFGGLICERGLDGRLGFAHSAVKVAIDSSFPLTDDSYRQELHWRIAQTLSGNARADHVRHADALWHALAHDSEAAGASASRWILFGLGKGPVGLPEYLVRVLAASLQVYGIRQAFFATVSEKVVLGMTRAMTSGAVREVPRHTMHELAVCLLDRARAQMNHPVHNVSIAKMALASALRAAVQFDPDRVHDYIRELETLLAGSKDGHSEVYLAFGDAAYLIGPDAARELIDRAVRWAESAIDAPIGTRADKSPDAPMYWGIDESGWSNLCTALETAHHFGLAHDAPRRILRYCDLLVQADPANRLKRRNYAAARILASTTHQAPDSQRIRAITELEDLLASQPDDTECTRLIRAATRDDDTSAGARRLLRPIDNLSSAWSGRFTVNEHPAHALWNEAAAISLATIDVGQHTAEEYHRLSMRLFAMTKFSCESDPGEKLTRSLSWLERAAAQDKTAIGSRSLAAYHQLTTADFVTPAHLRTLLRILRTMGSGWVAQTIPWIRSTSQHLVQSGESIVAALLLLDAAEVLKDWAYAPQFEEDRKAGRELGGREFGTKYYARLVAYDLRQVFDQITLRHLMIRGRILIAILDLGSIAVASDPD